MKHASQQGSEELEERVHEEFFGHAHVTVIEPHGRLFDLKLRELWAYRDLVLLFVRRDFLAQYKQTILGPAWHVIQPLLTTIVLTIVFGKLAQIPTDGLPPFLFYMAGTIIWTYFASVLTDTSATFLRNTHLFGKVYFPRLAVPVATLLSKLIGFAIQLITMLAFVVSFMLIGADVHPNLWILTTPLLLVLLMCFGLGLGVIVSAMTTRYRDLAVLVGIGVQLLMYASPIVYPLSVVPERWRVVAALNPIAPIVETFRYAYLGAGIASPMMLLYSAVVIIITLVVGVIMFNRVERTFMDSV